MVAAIFCMDTWMGHEEHFIEGENASELLDNFEKYQDLSCLSRMASSMGTKKDLKEIKKLDAILDKQYSGELSIEDLKDFKLDISIGKLSISDVASTPDEIEKIRR